MAEYTLSRSGRAPLRFRGELLGEQTTRASSGWRSNRWHKLALYSREGGGLILAVGYCTRWEGDSSVLHVAEASDVAGLDAWLEQYDPGGDPTVPPADPDKRERCLTDLRAGFAAKIDALLSAADLAVDDPLTAQELADAHEEFVRLALADLGLSRGEACAFCDANNGCFVSGGTWQSLWCNVADAPGLGDQAALVAKLQAAPLGTQYALAVAAKRFWQRCQEETDVVLRDIGLIG